MFDSANLLNEWMDPRHIEMRGFTSPLG